VAVIDLFRPFVAAEAAEAVARTLAPDDMGRVYIGEGPRVTEFERAFSELVGAPALMVNSGTAALELALYLCGVGIGTDVVTTPMTCTATNGAIVRLRGTPVWADVDSITGLIDPVDVQRKITRRTKAIMAVDWGGRLCDYEALRAVAGDIPIIQDAAHSLLATRPNGGTGVLGDYVCWSFQAIKHLTTGDGGALLPPARQANRARLLRWYGLDRTSSADFRCAQDIREVGWKAHMNDIAASIGLANLPHVERLVARHRANAAWYAQALQGAPVVCPPTDPGASWWLYTLIVNERDAFIAHMADHGVAASPVHRRNDHHTGFNYTNGSLIGLEHFSAHEVAIPVGWWVTDENLKQVAHAVNAWVREPVAA
jgi:dTDP-4-amino-4,6-dideoxygalactose transaminase